MNWGNLLRSSHTVKASSISEYQRSRSRYQLSKLGERIQRDADEVLAEADAAREVSNELLALVERGLRELASLVTAPGSIEPQDGLERVSTLFVQFTEFADSIRDFYAYLGQVLSRYDLDSAEYQGFKELLLDYVEAITEDVAFRAPRISEALDTLWPHIPALLVRLDAHAQGLAGLYAQSESRMEIRVQRSRGRELTDWEGLRGWFRDTDGQGSQVDQLRDATLRALQSLLANAKRMLRSATGEMSRRKDLLRLARWFEEAAPQDGPLREGRRRSRIQGHPPWMPCGCELPTLACATVCCCRPCCCSCCRTTARPVPSARTPPRGRSRGRPPGPTAFAAGSGRTVQGPETW